LSGEDFSGLLIALTRRQVEGPVRQDFEAFNRDFKARVEGLKQ
jgi:hypothetical protein